MTHCLPEIKLIPIKDIVFHEVEEPKRTRKLQERIVSDGFLKNPVIVGRIKDGDSRSLLLDGVHRVSALRNLGFKEVPAQVVRYFDGDVKVDKWCHLIQNASIQDLLKRITKKENPMIEKTTIKRAKNLLKEKKIACFLFTRNGDAFVMKCDSDLKTRTLILIEVVSVCYNSFDVKRGTETETTLLLSRQKAVTAVLTPPVYEKEEIVKLAFDNVRLSPGITRHIVPSRVLGFHVDLGLLKAEVPLRDKNNVVQEMLNYRIANEKTRFYPESVLVFDD